MTRSSLVSSRTCCCDCLVLKAQGRCGQYRARDPDNMNTLIALDCDGVLLDYNAAYPAVWRRVYGQELVTVRPDSYHAVNRFSLRFGSEQERRAFRARFSEEDWESMPALPGALAACRRLVEAGFQLICVTALPQRFRKARQANLERLGFPISDVLATDGPDGPDPKSAVIARMAPLAFVDDLAENFRGVADTVCKALIDRGWFDSPNRTTGRLLSDWVHPDLAGFSRAWCERAQQPLA